VNPITTILGLVAGEEKMKALNTLKTPIAAQLIPSFKKTERRLLSVFMRVLDIIPEFRGHILELVGYRGGKTSDYKSFMEPSFDLLNSPHVRPDGLLTCKRGAKEWCALVEAKSDNHNIRPEQVADYTNLAKLLNIDTVISISNEFASEPSQLPYTLVKSKRKGRNIYHLSWSQLASEMTLFLEGKNKLNQAEQMVMGEAIRYFSAKDSGVSTFDEMSPSWKDFVDSANTVIGFNTNTPGVIDIVKDWQQEQRDLGIKLNEKIGGGVETWYPTKLRHDPVERRKSIRERLTSQYQLEAIYIFKESKTKLSILADLRACSTTYVYDFAPPSGKQIRALSSWLGRLLATHSGNDFKVMLDWPGREPHSIYNASEIVHHPEIIINKRNYLPKSISLVTSQQDARRFKSRKRFIEDLEKGADNLVSIVSRFELI